MPEASRRLGVSYFGMSSLIDPASGKPLVNVAQALADPRWLAEMPASAANPLAAKVGWFNVSTNASAVFGVPVGFLTIILLSLRAKDPSPQTQAILDAVRAPAPRMDVPARG